MKCLIGVLLYIDHLHASFCHDLLCCFFLLRLATGVFCNNLPIIVDIT